MSRTVLRRHKDGGLGTCLTRRCQRRKQGAVRKDWLHLSVCPSVCLFVCLCLSVSVFLSLSASLSASLFPAANAAAGFWPITRNFCHGPPYVCIRSPSSCVCTACGAYLSSTIRTCGAQSEWCCPLIHVKGRSVARSCHLDFGVAGLCDILLSWEDVGVLNKAHTGILHDEIRIHPITLGWSQILYLVCYFTDFCEYHQQHHQQQ